MIMTCNICLEDSSSIINCFLCKYKCCDICIYKWTEKSQRCPHCRGYRTFNVWYPSDLEDKDSDEDPDEDSPDEEASADLTMFSHDTPDEETSHDDLDDNSDPDDSDDSDSVITIIDLTGSPPPPPPR